MVHGPMSSTNISLYLESLVYDTMFKKVGPFLIHAVKG